jgi:hypothetical protein
VAAVSGGYQEGKLTGVVDYWFRGGDGAGSDLAEQLARYGLDESHLPEHVRRPAEVVVWPEHEEAVMLFMLMSTQWRVGVGGRCGLDYGVVFQMMDLYDVRNRREALENLQIMEAHALMLFSKAAS